MITDYMITAGTLYWALKSWASYKKTNERLLYYFVGLFLAIGLGAFTGGTHHGFETLAPHWLSFGLWKVTQVLVGVATVFLLAILFEEFKSKSFYKSARTVCGSLLVGSYLFSLLYFDTFLVCILLYLSIVFALLIVSFVRFLQKKDIYHLSVFSGLVITVIAAGVQMSGVSLHRHFTHNDLYHVIQLFGLYVIYRGLPLTRVE